MSRTVLRYTASQLSRMVAADFTVSALNDLKAASVRERRGGALALSEASAFSLINRLGNWVVVTNY
jgi:hypothetical protein